MVRTRGPAAPTLPRSARKAIGELASPGPHRVLRGELGLVGLPGVIYAPAEGTGLPAVAFGHDWLQSVDRYLPLLRHLASWGFVVAAPASHRGPLPSHARFGADLRTALDVCAGVRLGVGDISVDRRRLALVGHGMGGGCAVLAAADRERAGEPVAAVVTLAVSETRPSAIDAASAVHAPALHLAAGRDQISPPPGNADAVADEWAGPVILRALPKANHLGFLYGRSLVDNLLAGKPHTPTARLARALTTAFLLHAVTPDQALSDLVTADLKGTDLVLAR
ncbi:dienelactone hydrolase family protein [Pseudonocardia acaciae]|uniref:dienelactone hydrolase family protein n=1 Tax=Pseudonocardia acaciae TaxID=551276 RepID=UPI000AB93CB7|nr:alpha/beta hydrolase [Pseudonocardia acaciae]